MRKVLIWLGYAVWIIFGLWSFIIELFYAYVILGVIGIIMGITLFPVLLTAMPFYALFAYGNASPLILSGISIFGVTIAGIFSKKI